MDPRKKASTGGVQLTGVVVELPFNGRVENVAKRYDRGSRGTVSDGRLQRCHGSQKSTAMFCFDERSRACYAKLRPYLNKARHLANGICRQMFHGTRSCYCPVKVWTATSSAHTFYRFRKPDRRLQLRQSKKSFTGTADQQPVRT